MGSGRSTSKLVKTMCKPQALTVAWVLAGAERNSANLLLVRIWVKLKTHSEGGITDKDFALARKIEEVVLWRPEAGSPLTGTPNKFVQLKK
jgi:hypothetical protein